MMYYRCNSLVVLIIHRHVVLGLQLATNQWVHLAIVYDGFTLKTYVNGHLNTDQDAPGNTHILSNYTVYVLGNLSSHFS